MTLAGAVTRINTWSISTWTNLGDSWNTAPPESKLPALALDFSDGGKAFEDVDFSQASGVARVPILHTLLVSSAGGYTPAKRQLIWGYIDSYLAKARSDLTLNSNLAVPMQIGMITVGAEEFYGTFYVKVKFFHLWTLAV